MVAPGKNLDFLESAFFTERADQIPGFRDWITDHLRSWPNAGLEVCEGVRSVELTWNGRNFAVLVARLRNGRSLMHVFEIPREDGRMAEVLKDFAKTLDGKSARQRKRQ